MIVNIPVMLYRCCYDPVQTIFVSLLNWKLCVLVNSVRVFESKVIVEVMRSGLQLQVCVAACFLSNL